MQWRTWLLEISLGSAAAAARGRELTRAAQIRQAVARWNFREGLHNSFVRHFRCLTARDAGLRTRRAAGCRTARRRANGKSGAPSSPRSSFGSPRASTRTRRALLRSREPSSVDLRPRPPRPRPHRTRTRASGDVRRSALEHRKQRDHQVDRSTHAYRNHRRGADHGGHGRGGEGGVHCAVRSSAHGIGHEGLRQGDDHSLDR